MHCNFTKWKFLVFLKRSLTYSLLEIHTPAGAQHLKIWRGCSAILDTRPLNLYEQRTPKMLPIPWSSIFGARWSEMSFFQTQVQSGSGSGPLATDRLNGSPFSAQPASRWTHQPHCCWAVSPPCALSSISAENIILLYAFSSRHLCPEYFITKQVAGGGRQRTNVTLAMMIYTWLMSTITNRATQGKSANSLNFCSHAAAEVPAADFVLNVFNLQTARCVGEV